MFISQTTSKKMDTAYVTCSECAAGISFGNVSVLSADPDELFRLGCLLQVAATQLQKRKDSEAAK